MLGWTRLTRTVSVWRRTTSYSATEVGDDIVCYRIPPDTRTEASRKDAPSGQPFRRQTKRGKESEQDQTISMPTASHQNNCSSGGKTKSGTQVSTKARRQDNPSGVGKIPVGLGRCGQDSRGLSSAPPAAPRLASEAPARLQTERCACVQRAS